MADDNTDIKIALAKLEQVTASTAEASQENTRSHTALNIKLTELIGTIRESNTRTDLILESSTTKANATSDALTAHTKYADPILIRSKRYQDNLDKMVTGIFSKGGLVVVGFILLAIAAFLGIDPSSIKFK
ncbi:MAG TPA: hypothetical protein EYN54_13405 [Methylococcaceae bacterium]|nr:hypothetical protein [Methylococcaceae bacterium]